MNDGGVVLQPIQHGINELFLFEHVIPRLKFKVGGDDCRLFLVPHINQLKEDVDLFWRCLLYTSPSPRDRQKSRMPSSA